jgi:hypothetical protein
VPPAEPEVNPEGSFVEGEEGVVVIYFHSNPAPIRLSWVMQDMDVNLTSTETNMTIAAGRYTSEGWKPTVSLDYMHNLPHINVSPDYGCEHHPESQHSREPQEQIHGHPEGARVDGG